VSRVARKPAEKSAKPTKSSGAFLFLEKDRNTIGQDFSLWATFQISTCILHWSVMVERKKGFGLLDL